MNLFTGTGVALVTPFDDKNKIDDASLRQLTDYVITGGVDFLTIMGTTAETATLSAAEKTRVVDCIAAENRGRVPMLVGIGGNNTAEVLRELKKTTWLDKCDGILCVTPYYNKPSQDGMYEHFKLVSEKALLPVILYNVPGRTGVNLTAETTLRLANDCPNIAGIKEASGNFEQATDILKEKKNGFVALSGDDSILLPLMAMGFDGVISVIANAFPAEYARLVDSMKKGDYPTARAIHFQLSEVCKLLFAEGNPAGIKAVLHVKKIIRYNKLRLPLTPVGGRLYWKIQRTV